MIDRGMLYAWVVAEDRHRQAAIKQAELDRDSALPLLTKGKGGVPIISPYVRVMQNAADAMIRCASELGFTPALRPRLAEKMVKKGEQEVDMDSPWAQLRLLQGGKSSA
jgi:phage terminase small subunit